MSKRRRTTKMARSWARRSFLNKKQAHHRPVTLAPLGAFLPPPRAAPSLLLRPNAEAVSRPLPLHRRRPRPRRARDRRHPEGGQGPRCGEGRGRRAGLDAVWASPRSPQSRAGPPVPICRHSSRLCAGPTRPAATERGERARAWRCSAYVKKGPLVASPMCRWGVAPSRRPKVPSGSRLVTVHRHRPVPPPPRRGAPRLASGDHSPPGTSRRLAASFFPPAARARTQAARRRPARP